jgi:hypothetical protein
MVLRMGIYVTIKLVRMIMDDNSVKVKVGNKLSETIQFSAGVKRVDVLSNTSFHTALHSVVNSVYQKGILS